MSTGSIELVTSFPTFVAYDVTRHKVGCVLVQVGLGGDSLAAQEFDNQDWLLSPTAEMRTYRLNSRQELERLKSLTVAKRESR